MIKTPRAILIEPVGIETVQSLLLTYPLIILIEPVGIETVVWRRLYYIASCILIEPVGIETTDWE